MKKLLLIFGISLLAIAGCKENSTNKAETESATKQATASCEAWVKTIETGDYEKAYNEASEYLKVNIKKKKFIESVNAARKPLGSCISRKIVIAGLRNKLPAAPDGEYAIIKYNSVFKNKSISAELVTMIKEHGKWKAAGYFIK